jgi:transcriptional regulator with XRE-family HTH domain
MKKNIKLYKNKVFAENFNFLMFSKKLTLKEISEKTDIPLSTLSTWKRGRIPRDKTLLTKLAKLFGTSKSELLNSPNHNAVFSNEKTTQNNDTSTKILNFVKALLNSTTPVEQNQILKKLIKMFPPKKNK